MKILSQEKLPKSQIKLTIEVSEGELLEFINQAVRRISQSVKIPGFRPGRAPRPIIEKEVGKDKILAEALDLALPRTYFDAVTSLKLAPIAKPEIKIQEFKENYLKYEAKISLMPEVNLDNWKVVVKKADIKPREVKIDEKQVNQALEDLRRQFAQYKEVSRGVRKGDYVEIDFESKLEGKLLEGGKSQNHPLIVGQGVFVPGFEEKLIGMKKGEDTTFSLKFPSNYHKKNLASKKVDFKVKINVVKEVILPELDDKFGQNFGKKNLTEFKEEIHKALKKKATIDAEREFGEKLVEYLISQVKIDIPDVLIDEEINHILEEFNFYLSHKGLSLEKYLESIKKTKEDFRKSFVGEAERRIKVALVLAEIAKLENIQVPWEEIEEEAKIRKMETKNEDQKAYLANVVRNKKTVELIKKEAISTRGEKN